MSSVWTTTFAGLFVLCGCTAAVVSQVSAVDSQVLHPSSTSILIADEPTLGSGEALYFESIDVTSILEYERISTQSLSTQILFQATAVHPDHKEKSTRTITRSPTPSQPQPFASMTSSSLISASTTAGIPSVTPAVQQVSTQSLFLPRPTSILPLSTYTSSPVLVTTVDKESTAIVFSSAAHNRSSYIVDAFSFKAPTVGTATESAAPPRDPTIHLATAPTPKSSSHPDATGTLRPTERDTTTEATPTGYRDLGFAVASVTVAVLLLVGSVLAVSLVGMVTHFRIWRDAQWRTGARGLERRSDSFRYTQSY